MDTKSYKLSEEILKYLESKNIKSFLPVQESGIPHLLNYKDSFIEAPTGTGKTLTFLIPIIENINVNSSNTQALILTPTKELAIQINNVLNEIKEFLKTEIKSTLAIGGNDFNDQLRKINNGTQIIIGTAERVSSLYKKTQINLSELKYFVIDEIDMFMNFGSLDNNLIIKEIPYKSTLAFFSASFPIEMQNYVKKIFNKEIKNIIIKNKEDDILESKFIKAYDENKIETLYNLINSPKFNPYFALIFAKTNDEVKDIYSYLKNKGTQNISMFQSELGNRDRKRLLKSINNSEIVYLITTDLMSRGMDFPGVTHIVNYSLPVDLTYYKHRIGRTNRNSVKGNIYDIYIDSDVRRYKEIAKKNKNIDFVNTRIK